MKTETAIKIIARYVKGLSVMEKEALMNNEKSDAEHYKVDRVAMEMAINSLRKD